MAGSAPPTSRPPQWAERPSTARVAHGAALPDEELGDEVRADGLPCGGTITHALQGSAPGPAAQLEEKGIGGLLDDSDSEVGGDELGQLHGAKGALAGEGPRRAMAKSPQAFSTRMKQSPLTEFECDSLTPHSPLRYATDCIPSAGQRTLGHRGALSAHIHSVFIKEDTARARMLAAAGLMAAERSASDDNGKTAWRRLGLQQPPWHEWSPMDVNSVRKEYSRSRLADNRGVAAVISDMRGEDFLAERRHAVAVGKDSGKDRKESEGA